jgi:hypothetical protein
LITKDIIMFKLEIGVKQETEGKGLLIFP